MLSSFVPLPTDVPVDPDALEAQQWVIDELQRGIYQQEPSLLQRFLNWLADLINSIAQGAGAPSSAVVIGLVVLLLAGAATVALLQGGRLRRGRAAATGTRSTQLFDDARSAQELAADARAAAERGDFTAAALDQYRAVVRELDERVLLDDRPGMTAHEAALAGARIFPALAAAWHGAGSAFDTLAYGHATGTAADWQAMRQLTADVERAQPALSLAVAHD